MNNLPLPFTSKYLIFGDSYCALYFINKRVITTSNFGPLVRNSLKIKGNYKMLYLPPVLLVQFVKGKTSMNHHFVSYNCYRILYHGQV